MKQGNGLCRPRPAPLPSILSPAPHRHEHEDEVFYVLDGEVTLMQDDDVTTAGPGSVVVLPRGHFHTFWNEGDVPPPQPPQ